MRILAIAVVLAALVRIAQADTAKPWANGVSEAEQTAALALYRDGNSEFEESRYAQALAKYREALKHWDHPGIRFNMAVCLVNLDQPLEAYDHLEHALAYGAAPLGDEAYAQGLTYKKLLSNQLATVKVTCDATGASVTFDGQPLLSCPGEASRRVLPGPHQVVASKQGFMTDTTSLQVVGGKDMVHAVTLAPIEVKTRLVHTHMVRRWNARTPWIIAGAGAAIAALGGVALVVSKNEYDTYDQLLEAQCAKGCGPEAQSNLAASTTDHETSGHRWNIIGLSALSVGGAALVAGFVGVYLNQPHAVADEGPIIVPTASATSAGASVLWSF